MQYFTLRFSGSREAANLVPSGRIHGRRAWGWRRPTTLGDHYISSPVPVVPYCHGTSGRSHALRIGVATCVRDVERNANATPWSMATLEYYASLNRP